MTRPIPHFAAILALACALAAGTVVGENMGREYDVKTAFLYNFALFTDWPARAPPGMVYCLLGEDRFGQSLDALASGHLRGGPVGVQRLPATSGVAKCHVLFIGARDSDGLRRGVEAARGLPVLTVSDAPQALASGVMIAMAYETNRVVFDVNLDPVKQAGLSVSSKLLRLARVVH